MNAFGSCLLILPVENIPCFTFWKKIIWCWSKIIYQSTINLPKLAKHSQRSNRQKADRFVSTIFHFAFGRPPICAQLPLRNIVTPAPPPSQPPKREDFTPNGRRRRRRKSGVRSNLCYFCAPCMLPNDYTLVARGAHCARSGRRVFGQGNCSWGGVRQPTLQLCSRRMRVSSGGLGNRRETGRC